MAVATTPEHVETHTAPVAERPQQVEVRKVAIDNNLLSVLAVGVALFVLAFGAFTHLRERIDSTATELRSEIKDVNTKIDKQGAELNAKIERVDAKIDAVNARLDRLFELLAAQGRREP